MWQQVVGHMASLEEFIPRGKVRMHLLQWQLKAHWSASVDSPAAPVPSSEERALHVSNPEMKTVQLALDAFLQSSM